MDKKLSVVVAVYNGEKYIIEQLNSIRQQSVAVDEVVIKDDGSSDNTCPLVGKYIEEHDLNGWKLISNEQNQGWKKNFVDGLNYVSGDYIFFCDQDDIWMENKVEKMVSIMESNSKIELLVSNYEVFQVDNSKNYIKNQKNKGNEDVYHYNLSSKCLYVKYPGCVYCFRKELIPFYKKYWKEIIPHDAFVWHLATVRNSLYVCNEPLIRYRRHENTVTGRNISNKDERIQELEYYKEIIGFYKKYLQEVGNEDFEVVYLENAEKWLNNREKVLKEKSIEAIFRSVKYIPYYWSFKTCIMDMIV